MLQPKSRRRLTVEDLYAMPDDGRKYELEAGFLVSEPLPGFRHGRVVAAVAAVLDAHVRRHKIGFVLAGDPGFILARKPDTVRGPDVAFVSIARASDQADSMKAFAGAPDLAVEVLSPSNTRPALRAKAAEYLAAGARRVWIVDPEAKTVTVYASLFSPHVLGEDDTLEGGDVIPGFSVAVSEFFVP